MPEPFEITVGKLGGKGVSAVVGGLATLSEVGKGRDRIGTGSRIDRTASRFFFSWMRQSAFPDVRQFVQGNPTTRASQRTMRR
jgi:hypothetical protein